MTYDSQTAFGLQKPFPGFARQGLRMSPEIRYIAEHAIPSPLRKLGVLTCHESEINK